MARTQLDSSLDIALGLASSSPRFRILDPERGRFEGVDWFEGVASDPLTLNKYAYGHADPVNNIDPSGHMSLSSTIASIGIGYTIGAVFLGAVYQVGSYPAFGSGLNGNIGRLYGSRATLGLLLVPQLATRLLDEGHFDDDGTVATATSTFRHRWMNEYAVLKGLTPDGNWHRIDVSPAVDTYAELIDPTDVPSVPGFFIGGLYSLRAKGSYEAKVNPNGTSSFRNVRMDWLATDIVDAHTYNEARKTGSSVVSALIESFFGYVIGDTILGAKYDLFVYFYEDADIESVPASRRWNY